MEVHRANTVASNRPVLDSGSVLWQSTVRSRNPDKCNPLQSTVRSRNPEPDGSKRMEIDSTIFIFTGSLMLNYDLNV